MNIIFGFASIIILIQLTWITTIVYAGSCREAQLCCNGRDSSCVVQKIPINAIIEDLKDKPCYCDDDCLKLGDCCEDFEQHCGALDCEVSEWNPWSDCDTTCGTGTMTRNRTIERPPQNGGKECPSLVENRGCQGYRCHGHKDHRVLREMAILLPAAYSKNRHANDVSDIRRNLRLRYRDSFKHNREHEYCAEFQVLKVSKACRGLAPYDAMSEGELVTVRCDLEALITDSYNSSTQSGSNSKNGNHNHTDITNNLFGNDDEDSNRIIPLSKHQHSKYRCRGEGLPGRSTRWRAFSASSCRGKWLRLTIDQPKKCTKSQFIFV